MDYFFDAETTKNQLLQWIRDYFEYNGKTCQAVIGISGGKDSSVVAALCVKALGKDRVVGVLMPQGTQPDIDYAVKLCEFLGIEHHIINVFAPCKSIKHQVRDSLNGTWSAQSATNLPARIRMATLYAVAQSLPNGGRVANTCNLSEDWVGYSTRYGDSAGDFAPLGNLTVEEVKKIGLACGLPEELVNKTPSDGLCGKTDEDNLGFTYQELDDYLRRGIDPSPEKKKKIDDMHKRNRFKLEPMPSFWKPFRNPKLV